MQARITRCRNHGSTTDPSHLTSLRKQMTHLMIHDKYWRHQAKKHWYRDGDLNTKILHAYATSRKKVICIFALGNDVGERISYENCMCQVAKGYFEELFLEGKKIALELLLLMLLHR